MPPKLVIHAGSFKSGSTAIQFALAKKACRCSTASIFYPGLNRREGAEKIRGQHGSLAETLYPEKAARKQQEEMFTRVADNIRSAGADVNVISAEKFEHANPKALKSAIAQFLPDFQDRLQIIFYVRPHAERLLSGYAERVKHGLFHGSVEELHAQTRELTQPRQRGFFYHPRLQRWHETFGERLTVRPMVRSLLYRQDVVADFFQHILAEDAFSLPAPQQRNSSPALEDLAVVRAFHQAAIAAGADPRQQEKFGNTLIKTYTRLGSRGSTKLALHRSLAEDVAAVYQEDAAALDHSFFEGTPMQDALARAVEAAVAEAQTTNLAALLNPGELRQAMAWVETAADILSRGRQRKKAKTGQSRG